MTLFYIPKLGSYGSLGRIYVGMSLFLVTSLAPSELGNACPGRAGGIFSNHSGKGFLNQGEDPEPCYLYGRCQDVGKG